MILIPILTESIFLCWYWVYHGERFTIFFRWYSILLFQIIRSCDRGRVACCYYTGKSLLHYTLEIKFYLQVVKSCEGCTITHLNFARIHLILWRIKFGIYLLRPSTYHSGFIIVSMQYPQTLSFLFSKNDAWYLDTSKRTIKIISNLIYLFIYVYRRYLLVFLYFNASNKCI